MICVLFVQKRKKAQRSLSKIVKVYKPERREELQSKKALP